VKVKKTDEDESEEASDVEAEDAVEIGEKKEITAKDQKEQAEDDDEKDDDDKTIVETEAEEGPPAPVKKKAGLNMGGVAISIVGVLGVVGAVLWDPFMNILDSKRSAAINVGTTQLFGIVAAALVLVVGVIIVFAMRKKTAAS
jgi:hypothetical protein